MRLSSGRDSLIGGLNLDPDAVLCGPGPISDKLRRIITFQQGGPIFIGVTFLAFTIPL